MAKRKNGNAWRQWYDPDATDEDYKRWRDEHRARVLQEIQADISEAARGNDSASAQAHAAGLSASTVARYRAKPIGPRGPTLLTYRLLRRY